MPPASPPTEAVQDPYVIPDCGCGEKECIGPEPVPWLSWKHCFRFYEFRYGVVPVREAPAVAVQGRLLIRVRYEHLFCLIGRKQGPIVHSLTLLPKEQVRIYEYDRYRRSTSVTNRFSARSSFFTMTQRVQDAYSSTKVSSGASVSTSSSAGASGGGGLDLGIISFGGGASFSSSATTNAHFNVASVSEQFRHVAETSSLAVETERSVVVSTFEETESFQSTARLLRNDNECRAVTYTIRRVFEVYRLMTRIVGIDVQIGDQWIDLDATAKPIQDEVRKFLEKTGVGASHDPEVEIALPTDGLLYEAELAHCCSCECEHEAKSRLDLEKLQLENLNLRLEAERRRKRLDSGELDAFLTAPVSSDGED
jgi:hypothetical protein